VTQILRSNPKMLHIVRSMLLPALLLVVVAACTPAATAGVEADAPVSASTAGGVALLNRAEALRAMDRAYEPLLRDAGVTGTVVADLALEPDGTVRAARVVRSTHDSFSPSARSAARAFRFAPPAQAGAVVRVRMEFIYNRGEITVIAVE
jgi:TonB family protein